jgi:TPR repeat protein
VEARGHGLARRVRDGGSPRKLDQSGAVDWFRKAAWLGAVNGMEALSHCYRDGIGVSADERAASSWAQKARALRALDWPSGAPGVPV